MIYDSIKPSILISFSSISFTIFIRSIGMNKERSHFSFISNFFQIQLNSLLPINGVYGEIGGNESQSHIFRKTFILVYVNLSTSHHFFFFKSVLISLVSPRAFRKTNLYKNNLFSSISGSFCVFSIFSRLFIYSMIYYKYNK